MVGTTSKPTLGKCTFPLEKLTGMEVPLNLQDMRMHRKQSTRALWIGLTLVLPVVYLCQIAPHTHDAHPQPQPQHASTSHSNHTHSHDNHENERPDASHHHHALTNHLDSHVRQMDNRGSSSDPEISFEVVTADLGILDRKNRYRTPDRPEPPPKAPPIVASGPRAPPLQG